VSQLQFGNTDRLCCFLLFNALAVHYVGNVGWLGCGAVVVDVVAVAESKVGLRAVSDALVRA